MKIVYLHGLGANNLGQKNNWLKSVSELFDPYINYSENNIYKNLKTQISTFKPDILIGSSMGGYFAYKIAKELGSKTILFNPALHSRSYEPDMTGNEEGKCNPLMYFVFGKNDNIINPMETLKIIEKDGNKNKNYILLNHGHDTPLEVFKKQINFFIYH